MTEWQLKRERKQIKQELDDIRERIATMRQTYDEMEAISNFIKGIRAS